MGPEGKQGNISPEGNSITAEKAGRVAGLLARQVPITTVEFVVPPEDPGSPPGQARRAPAVAANGG